MIKALKRYNISIKNYRWFISIHANKCLSLIVFIIGGCEMNLRLETYRSGRDIPPIGGKSLFHSKELFLLFEETRGYTPYMVVVYDDDRYLMHILAVIQRDKYFFSHSLVRRCEVFDCGDFDSSVTNREELFGIALKYLTDLVSRYSFLIEFRNLADARFGYKSFRDNGYFPINWMRVYNSLHGDKTIDKRLSPSRIRQVRKGLRNGAEVGEASSETEIGAFARMLRHVYSSHIRKYFPDKTFFYNVYHHTLHSGLVRIFVVRYKDKVIGGSVCLYSKSTAYLWFSGGMRKTYSAQYPGVLAVWKAMTDAQERGYRHFEFVDVGLPFKRHGFREFVLRFGGKQSSTRRWFRFRWGWLNNLFVWLYS